MRIQNYFFVLLVILFSSFSFVKNASSFSSVKYAIITPKVLTRESVHKFYLEVYDDNYEISSVSIISKDFQISDLSVEENFTVSQNVNNTYTVEYCIPFKNFRSSRIELKFIVSVQNLTVERNKSFVLINKSVDLGVIISNLVFIETNKPVYKPKDEVKFRMLSILPQSLYPFSQTKEAKYEVKQFPNNTYYLNKEIIPKLLDDSSIIYKSVYLESPSKMKMFEWKKLTWIDALKGLTWKLSADPEFGIWKIITNLDSQESSTTFKVEKYVLPRFIVNVDAPKIVTTQHKFLVFTVCIKYNTGKAMKANVTAKLCVTNSDNKYTELQLIQRHNTFKHVPYTKRPCVVEEKTFSGVRVCEQFNVSTQLLDLKNQRDYDFRQRHIKINVTVIEAGSGMRIDKEVLSGELQDKNAISVYFSGPNHFKPGLPFYASIKLVDYDNLPLVNFSVSVELLTNSLNWAFPKKIYSTDVDGNIDYVFSVFPNSVEHVSIHIYSYDEKKKTNQELLFTTTLKPWYSLSSTYLQHKKIKQGITQHNFNCLGTNTFMLTLQSNTPLYDKTIFVKIQSKGEIVSSQTLFPISQENCQDSDSDEIGHYKCVKIENGKAWIRCLQNWTGDNCLTVVCNIKCFHGICIEPTKCQCSVGWSGENCNVCVTRLGCINGECDKGNDCLCKPGWTGYHCHQPTKYSFQKLQRKTMLYTTSTLPTDVDSLKEIKIFSRNVILKIDTAMLPDSRAIFYFVFNNSEFVTHTIELNAFSHCFMKQNAIDLTFPVSTALPKTKLNMTITGLMNNVTNNTCAWSIRDIAIKSLGSSGEPSIGIISSKLQELTQLVIDAQESSNPYEFSAQCPYARTYYYPNEQLDSTNSLTDAGLFMLSNVPLTATPCTNSYYYESVMYEINAREVQDDMSKMAQLLDIVPPATVNKKMKNKKVKLEKVVLKQMRSFFPEDWKFDYIYNPTDEIELTVPDTMTTWTANMFCVSKKFGLRIASESSLIVFQPFFIDLVLPYSLIRGEIADIPVKMFNYLPYCYGIIVQVISQEGFSIISETFNQFCLCDDLTFNLKIKGLKIGKVNVTLAAQGINLENCNNTADSNSKTNVTLSHISIENISDALTKEILIESEGIPQEITTGDLLCTKNGSSAHIVFQASPTTNDGIVSDSIRGYAMWTGDVMGNTLNNLDKLIKLPYGCGEQNMISMVPSIYVLQYFTSLNIGKPVAIAKAREYISIGYQRQLNYKLKDDSYSAFGESDRVGSTWLTAFVFKSFVFASKFVGNIDPDIIIRAQRFILSKQHSGGCFGEDGRVIHGDLKGGLGQANDNNATLTAYIMAAFLENAANRSNLLSVVKNAAKCIKQSTHPEQSDKWNKVSTYSIALRAYALNLYNSSDPMSIIYNRLLSAREQKNKGYTYWTDGTTDEISNDIYYENRRSTAADVETTAYSLLAKLTLKTVPVIDLIPIIKWLTTQRNSEGGWYSTQDTVVGLQAMSTFAELVDSNKINLNLSLITDIDGDVSTNTSVINEDNWSIFYKNSIAKIPSVIKFKVTGEGCLMTLINIKFNQVKVDKSKEPFTLITEVIQESLMCHVATLKICAKTNEKNFKTGMAIIKVKLVSGWEILTECVANLTELFVDGGLRRIETEKNIVTLYYDYMSNQEICTELNLKKNLIIFDPKPASIQIYDYYSPDILTELFYNMSHVKCKTLELEKVIQKAPSCPICKTFANFEQFICPNGAPEFLTVGKKISGENWLMSIITKKMNFTISESKMVKIIAPYECVCKAPSMFVTVIEEESIPTILLARQEIVFIDMQTTDLSTLRKSSTKCPETLQLIYNFLNI